MIIFDLCFINGIPYYAWSLFAWLAHKSEYRNHNGLPVIYYDCEECELHGVNAPTNLMRIDDKGLIIRNTHTDVASSLVKLFKLGPDFEAQAAIMNI